MNSIPLPTEPFAHADLDGRPRSAPPLSSAGREPVAQDSPAGRAAGALARAWASDDAGSAERLVRSGRPLAGSCGWRFEKAGV